MSGISSLVDRFAVARQHTVRLCAPLSTEAYVAQPIVDVSPPKWHLGHTAWFFEARVLEPKVSGYKPFNERFGDQFHSDDESHGQRVARADRGHMTRPTVAEVLDYRTYVDTAMVTLLERGPADELLALIELGLQHEQQHQELLLTDIKFILGNNSLHPSYDDHERSGVEVSAEHQSQGLHGHWIEFAGGLVEVGHAGSSFAFDNEGPRHVELVRPVQLRTRLVSNQEYQSFMADDGYERVELWHSDGWQWLQQQSRRAPLYWQPDRDRPGQWLHYTLTGLEPVWEDTPLTHVSHYEAHAFCVWAGWRLPSEFEWEATAGDFMWGQRWEWTSSAYQPYPEFQPAPGAVGEYNGKFMINQTVLRGASFATPPGHARVTYRNFFQPPLRWQYTGIRPAKDV